MAETHVLLCAVLFLAVTDAMSQITKDIVG